MCVSRDVVVMTQEWILSSVCVCVCVCVLSTAFIPCLIGLILRIVCLYPDCIYNVLYNAGLNQEMALPRTSVPYLPFRWPQSAPRNCVLRYYNKLY